jgi:hypothetical protein
VTLWLLKLVLTPLLVGAITLCARRWGHRLGGTLAGLPLTSGPVSVFLLLEQGEAFAARAAEATVLGLVGVVAYCLTYSLCSFRLRAGWCVLLASLALSTATYLLSHINVPLLLAFLFALTSIVLARRFLGTVTPERPPAQEQVIPPWDIPLRMLIAAGVVGALTLLATRLGPQLTGIISPWPVVIAIIAASVHVQASGLAARQVMRGALAGSFAFALFFFLVANLLQTLTPLVTYGLATFVALGAATFLQGDLRSRP